MKHRLLHIVPSLECYGTTKRLANLAAALPTNEFESRAIALRAEPAATELARSSGMDFVHVSWRGKFDAIACWRLSLEIRRVKPEIVQIWSLDDGAYHAWAVAIASGVKKVIVSIWNLGDWNDSALPGIHRWFIDRTDHFVTNSHTVRDTCIATGLPGYKITVLSDGVSGPSFSSITRQQFLLQHDLPADAKLIACLGELTKQRRIKELIWATDQLKAVGLPAHLFLLGDGPLRSRLERYSRLNQTEDRVHFLGQLPDAANMLSIFDVLWEACANDGQSTAILEAMAAGIPVVAADSPGNRQLICNGQTGYLVPRGERAGFARWTLPLLENAELARQIGCGGQQNVLQNFRLDEMADRYSALYRQLLA